MNNNFQQSLWEDFTDALMDNRIKEAEMMLEEADDHSGEAAWTEIILKMYDEWALWLIGKSEFNHHENKQLTHG